MNNFTSQFDSEWISGLLYNFSALFLVCQLMITINTTAYWFRLYYLAVVINRSYWLKHFFQPADFKSNFLNLKQLVLIGGPDDGVITPWQSRHVSLLMLSVLVYTTLFEDYLHGKLKKIHTETPSAQ